MANRTSVKLTQAERQRRTFSESFKKQKVKDFQSGRVRLCELVREYQLSYTTIYRWLRTFGNMKEPKERLVVETQSDTQELIRLKKQIAELERTIGQKQLQIDFKNKMIDLAEEMYKVDIKKKFGERLSATSGSTAKK